MGGKSTYVASQYKGVASQTGGKTYAAHLWRIVSGTGYYIGTFATEDQAAKAYDKCAAGARGCTRTPADLRPAHFPLAQGLVPGERRRVRPQLRAADGGGAGRARGRHAGGLCGGGAGGTRLVCVPRRRLAVRFVRCVRSSRALSDVSPLFSKRVKKWQARMRNATTGNQETLGYFDNEEDAARTYDACVP
jgi:hypothetical protein